MKIFLFSNHREKIDYILTVCLYCWQIWISRTRITIQKGVFHVIRLFIKILLPKKYLHRFYRRHVEAMKAQDLLFGNLEYGNDISTAKTMVFHSCCYLALPVIITTCIIGSLIGWSVVISWLINDVGIIIPLILCGIIVFCASKIMKTPSDSHFYIYYFKVFQKKDEEWLKKWKRYTVLLFIGSFVSFIMCIGVIVLFSTLNQNLYGVN